MWQTVSEKIPTGIKILEESVGCGCYSIQVTYGSMQRDPHTVVTMILHHLPVADVHIV